MVSWKVIAKTMAKEMRLMTEMVVVVGVVAARDLCLFSRCYFFA